MTSRLPTFPRFPEAEFESPEFKGWLNKISEYINEPKIFIGTFTRDNTASSAVVSYTGTGFKPEVILFFNSNGGKQNSWGWSDATSNMCVADSSNLTADTFLTFTTTCIVSIDSVGNNQSAVISTMDTNGFTLSWTETGAGSGTSVVTFLALRS